MKNIEAILKEAGLELTEDQTKAINEAVKENYKPVADWQKQVDKVKDMQETLDTTQAELKKFDGVNAEELNKKIKELTEQIDKNAKEYENKIAERDFTDTIEKAITAAKGKNTKAIKALLDLKTLKESKNQEADIKKAIADLTTAEDSKMLFGEPEPKKTGTGNPIGTVTKDGAGAQTETLASALAAHYNNN